MHRRRMTKGASFRRRGQGRLVNGRLPGMALRLRIHGHAFEPHSPDGRRSIERAGIARRVLLGRTCRPVLWLPSAQARRVVELGSRVPAGSAPLTHQPFPASPLASFSTAPKTIQTRLQQYLFTGFQHRFSSCRASCARRLTSRCQVLRTCR
jgi:hypothetical protein